MSEELDLLADNRPARYVEDDPLQPGRELVVYRASSVGGCPRALIAHGNAYDPKPHPQWFQEVLDEGTNAEAEINAQWELVSGMPTDRRQERVELEIGVIAGRRVIVRGHIDGAVALGMDLREYKKFRDSTWEKFLRQGVECNVNYPWQVSVLMYAGRYMSCQFVGGRFDKATGKIVEVQCKELLNPPIPLKAIKMKVAAVEREINKGIHPTEKPCGPKMYPCPFYYLHDADDNEQPPIKLEDSLLRERAEEWLTLKEQEDLAKRIYDKLSSRRKAVGQGIVGWMQANQQGDEHGAGKVTIAGMQVNVSYTPESEVKPFTRRESTKVEVKRAKEGQ